MAPGNLLFHGPGESTFPYPGELTFSCGYLPEKSESTTRSVVLTRASGTHMASSLKQNKFLTLELSPARVCVCRTFLWGGTSGTVPDTFYFMGGLIKETEGLAPHSKSNEGARMLLSPISPSRIGREMIKKRRPGRILKI